MYKSIYYKPTKKIKVPATDFIMCKNKYQPNELLRLFLEEKERYYCTAMCFPSRIVSVREHLVQQQNYDYFINTMADLIKKYATDNEE